MNRVCKLIAIVFLITSFYSCDNKGIILVDNGVSNYEITFLGEATKSKYKSAELLKTYSSVR